MIEIPVIQTPDQDTLSTIETDRITLKDLMNSHKGGQKNKEIKWALPIKFTLKLATDDREEQSVEIYATQNSSEPGPHNWRDKEQLRQHMTFNVKNKWNYDKVFQSAQVF